MAQDVQAEASPHMVRVLLACLAVVVVILLGASGVQAQPTATPVPTAIPLPWQGYILFEVTNANLEITPERYQLVKAAFQRLIVRIETRPDTFLQVGPIRLDRRAAIVEARWFQVPRKELIVAVLSRALGVSQTFLNNNLNIVIFGDEATWSQSHDEVLAYLEANKTAWFVEMPY